MQWRFPQKYVLPQKNAVAPLKISSLDRQGVFGWGGDACWGMLSQTGSPLSSWAQGRGNFSAEMQPRAAVYRAGEDQTPVGDPVG